jgi:hypothetical protein
MDHVDMGGLGGALLLLCDLLRLRLRLRLVLNHVAVEEVGGLAMEELGGSPLLCHLLPLRLVLGHVGVGDRCCWCLLSFFFGFFRIPVSVGPPLCQRGRRVGSSSGGRMRIPPVGVASVSAVSSAVTDEHGADINGLYLRLAIF